MFSLVSYNPLNKNPQRITKVGKKWLIILINFKGIEFPVSKKYYRKIELKNYIFVNVFCYENGLTYLIHTSKQKFEDCMDLLLFNDENKSHYIYIYISKYLTNLCSIEQITKTKNTFADIVYNVLVVKGFFWNIKKLV